MGTEEQDAFAVFMHAVSSLAFFSTAHLGMPGSPVHTDGMHENRLLL